MGIASYNRASRVIRQRIDMEQGTWRPDPTPTPRPETWGDKAMARAMERARRILRSNRRYGREIDIDVLTAAVMDRARVGQETARAAAEAVFADPDGSSGGASSSRRRRGRSRPRVAPVTEAARESITRASPPSPPLDLTPVPPGPHDPKGGFRIHGNVVQFWARKPQAVAEARRLGFRAASVVKVHTRFQIGYSIQGANGGLLSKALHEAMGGRG